MTMVSSDTSERLRYLQLHHAPSTTTGVNEEFRTAPLLTLAVKTAAVGADNECALLDIQRNHDFQQYGFLGCELPLTRPALGEQHKLDPIILNTNTPWSAFICGSQGSGKSYTLSCMLENCLHKSAKIGKLPKPLAGIVFHNDTRGAGSVCEAAHLASLGIKVNVLVSRSNFRALSTIYQQIPGAKDNLSVHPLLLRSGHLNVERMHRLMAFSEQEGAVPLYMEVIMRVLREMAIASDKFDYKKFRARLAMEVFAPGQAMMMNLRFNLLESFLDMDTINNKKATKQAKNVFDLEPGTLTIVDLSDPFVDASTACVLYDICFSLFEQFRPQSGLVVALDEAHKYMNKSSAADNFTEHLLTTIREQRHNATRIIIATQEPTISPRLLDLCSMTIVHRFTSPDWLTTLKGHLAAASTLVTTAETNTQTLFEQIIDLNAGESLLFAPSAILEMVDGKPKKLGAHHIKFKTRLRLGADGGRSVLALRSEDGGKDGEADSGEDDGNVELLERDFGMFMSKGQKTGR